MTYVDTLSDSVESIFKTTWKVRDGKVVPMSSDVALKDGAVKLDATFLYADLAGSSVLAQLCPWTTTAKIIRAYLDCAVRLIRVWDGEVRSFDGDRVMGVFVGSSKNTNASYCARELDYMVHHVLNPKAKSCFESISNNSITLKHCVGIDTGDCRAVRAGIRDNNDLIWIGKPPSLAAKLSDIRNYPREVYISSRTYNSLNTDAKYENGSDIWTSSSFVFAESTETVYSTIQLKRP
jgi:adenylate cyclase